VVATQEVDGKHNKDDSTSIIENDRAKLRYQNGQLQWESKTESLSVENLIQFEYVGDEGDTYTFSPVDGSRQVVSKASLNLKKSTSSGLVLTYVMEVPAGLRSSEKVTLSIEVTASLRQDGSVALRADYRNEAENGRLRMLLPTLTQRLDSIADGHFTLNRRKQTEWLDPKEFTDRYKAYPGELQYPTHYQGDFCFVEDGGRKTWVANKGLHEYEILGDGDNSFIAVTLHRSVGYLSVSNGKIRRPQAGPSIPTPGAQCKRRLSAELCWGTTDDELSALMLSARSFAHPPFSRQLPVIKNAPKEGPVPASRSLLTLDNPMIQLSSLHAADQDGDVILRLYNPSEADQTCSITIGFSATEFCESTLREAWRDETKQTIKRGVANIALKSNQIKTLRFRNDPSV